MHPSYLFPLYYSSPASFFSLNCSTREVERAAECGFGCRSVSSQTPSPQAVQRPVGLWYSVASRRTTLATVLSNRPMFVSPLSHPYLQHVCHGFCEWKKSLCNSLDSNNYFRLR